MKKEDIQQKKEETNVVCKECEILNSQINELVLTIDKVEDEKLVIENQLRKALADYYNLLNNSEKRNEIRVFQSRKSLCELVIPSLDALSMAIKSSGDIKFEGDSNAWFEGVKATLTSLSKSFEDIGLKQYIPVKGDKFDPNIHEALTIIEQGNSGEIYDLVQPGYILDNTVIRPARVVVSK